MKTNSQLYRLHKLFTENPWKDFSLPNLHRIASGKEHGYCGSFSRRISDLRKLGLDVRKSMDFRDDNGQRHTWYRWEENGTI